MWVKISRVICRALGRRLEFILNALGNHGKE